MNHTLENIDVAYWSHKKKLCLSNINISSGESLDEIGKTFKTKRLFNVGLTSASIETDANYRERLFNYVDSTSIQYFSKCVTFSYDSVAADEYLANELIAKKDAEIDSLKEQLRLYASAHHSAHRYERDHLIENLKEANSLYQACYEKLVETKVKEGLSSAQNEFLLKNISVLERKLDDSNRELSETIRSAALQGPFSSFSLRYENEKLKTQNGALADALQGEHIQIAKLKKQLEETNQDYLRCSTEMVTATLSNAFSQSIINQLKEENKRLYSDLHGKLNIANDEIGRLNIEKEIFRKQAEAKDKKPHKCPVCDGKYIRSTTVLLQDKLTEFPHSICPACEWGVIWK